MVTDRYIPEARAIAHLWQDLAEKLVEKGHEVAVLTKMPTDYLAAGEDQTREQEIPNSEIMNGVRIYRMRGIVGSRKSAASRAIDQIYLGAKLIRGAADLFQCDLVVVASPPLPWAAAVSFRCSLQKIPCVLNLHDIYPRTAIELGLLKSKPLIWAAKALEKYLYKSTSHIFVPNPGTYKILLNNKKCIPGNVDLIYNWIDTNKYLPGRKDKTFLQAINPEAKFIVSYVGLMGYAQDLKTIIDCARMIIDEEKIIFLLVGDGVLKEKWEEFSKDLRNVHFHSTVSKEQYYNMLRASDLCLVPLTEDLKSPVIPGKLQSIMAMSRPVAAIVPPDSDTSKVVEDSGCGFVIPSGSPEILRDAILDLCSNSNLRENLGKSGRRYAEEHFDLTDVVVKLEKVFQKIKSNRII